MADQQTSEKFELSEVMLAMDIVDTIRHDRSLVDRELQSDHREAELIAKLRKIYADQGLEVSDEVIADGVKAMREDRFTYQPPPRSFQTMLAILYIHRGRWFKRIAVMALVLIGLWAAYHYTVVMPAKRAQTELAESTKAIDVLHAEALKAVREPGAKEKIEAIYNDAKSAVQSGDADKITNARQALQAALDMLNQAYTVQVVSRPGTPSGVWRYPVNSRKARNYYLIVEAISPSGELLSLPITSEEDGTVRMVSAWGLRVDPQVFERVKQDKMDDGIVNSKVLGEKQRGYLTPTYTVATTGAAITEW
jgi:hypothetical protein